MANILTCIQTIQPTITSSTSANVWDIYSILMFFLPYSLPQFTQSFQGNVVYIEIMNCTLFFFFIISLELHADETFRYIKALHTYLISFTKRAQPLTDVESQLKEAEDIFNKQWEADEIEGWEDRRQEQAQEAGEGIWCTACKYTRCRIAVPFDPSGIMQVRSCTPSRPSTMRISHQKSISKRPRSKRPRTNHLQTPTVHQHTPVRLLKTAHHTNPQKTNIGQLLSSLILLLSSWLS